MSGFVTTGLTEVLRKSTIDNYEKSWFDIGAEVAVDTVVSYGFSKLPGINGLTAGRNSYAAVYKSGLTKLRNGTVSRMSLNVMVKGLVSNIVDGFFMDIYLGLKGFV